MNKRDVSPILLDFCSLVVIAAAEAAVGDKVKFEESDLKTRARELAEQFIVIYVDAGYPNGNTEAGLLKYIKDNISYEIGS